MNVVIGLDYISAGNFTSVHIPKYNNKVQNPDIFDKSTQVVLPRSMLRVPTSSGKYNSLSKRHLDVVYEPSVSLCSVTRD